MLKAFAKLVPRLWEVPACAQLAQASHVLQSCMTMRTLRTQLV